MPGMLLIPQKNSFSRSHRRRAPDVRLGKVVALVQQRQAAHFRERVAERIAKIQAGGVAAAFSIGHERRIGRVHLGWAGRDQFEHGQPEQGVHENHRTLPAPSVHDHTVLHDANRTDQ